VPVWPNSTDLRLSDFPVPASGLWSGSGSKVNQFVHVPTPVDTQNFIQIHASVLSNLANRQTDRQTSRATAHTSSFVGGKQVNYKWNELISSAGSYWFRIADVVHAVVSKVVPQVMSLRWLFDGTRLTYLPRTLQQAVPSAGPDPAVHQCSLDHLKCLHINNIVITYIFLSCHKSKVHIQHSQSTHIVSRHIKPSVFWNHQCFDFCLTHIQVVQNATPFQLN